MNHFQNYWNIMLSTDSYKVSHWKMLPDDLTYVESYGEARGGEFPYSVKFGLTYITKSYFEGVQVTEEKIQEAIEFYKWHFNDDTIFNEVGWRYILETHGGRLPLCIEAVEEGSIVPVSNALFKIYNTDPECAWLVNWCETPIMKVWYPITIATNSMAGKEMIRALYDKSGTVGLPDFMLHDFGYRGVTSEEQAWIGGAAHLLSFNGTDNVAGVRMLMKYYDAPMCGFSVNASEHMVMTVSGREQEVETYKRIIRKYPKGILSLVSDTYDIFNVCTFLGTDPELRELILNRDGKLVIRPDSGDPKEVLEKCLDILADQFGFTINEKGYKVINPKLGLLQGDGITIYTMYEIGLYLIAKGWSIDNIVFGSGGGLLQMVNRDTMKFAIKCSYAEIGEEHVDVYKDPITASGGKKSKKGQLLLMWSKENGYVTINKKDEQKYIDLGYVSKLDKVFFNGEILSKCTYNSIKEKMSHDVAHLDYLSMCQEKNK